MKPIRISVEEARRLAVARQGLDGMPVTPRGKAGAALVIENLGYVQIDTISVVERAHHQTIRARCPDYVPSLLHELLSVDRRIFEYWGHAASYLPLSDYRYYLPAMRRAPSTVRGKQWLSINRKVMGLVLQRIQQEGPLTSADFAHPEEHEDGAWWNWKPAKMALEMLLSQGRLMVSERRNFQRVYDLTERVLPPSVDTRMPSEEEVHRFLVKRALWAHGVATEREIRDHIGRMPLTELRTTIAALLCDGEMVAVTIDDLDAVSHYALPEVIESVPEWPREAPCRLLCPFDNLIIQRSRAEWLFDFKYTLECYVPASKRRWGYFVFPILLGDRLIGRLDPKAERKARVLRIRSLHFEDSIESIEDLLAPLSHEIARFARFNGCESVEFERIVPTGHKRSLKSLVRRALKGIPL